MNKEIFWAYDEMGVAMVMGWFVPVEQADEEVIQAYEKDKKKREKTIVTK